MILDSLNKLFTQSPEKEEYKDTLLRQGDLFLSFQDNYYRKVSPHLPLMEQTSSNGLQSVIEGLSSSKENGNLKNLEEKYNITLNQYIETSKQLTQMSVKHINHKHYKTKIDTLQSELMMYNDQLVKLAEDIYKTIEASEKGDKTQLGDNKKTKLFSTINELKTHQAKLKKNQPIINTYSGEFSDNELRVNYAYYHYIIWFLIVVFVIMMITMTALNVPNPLLKWPWSILFVILIIGVLWMGAKAIHSRFWLNVI